MADATKDEAAEAKKEEPIAPENPKLNAKILKQVDFYFSDSNLPGDKFMKGLVSKSPDRWAPLATIASFKRMKQMTTDVRVVARALRKSDLLEVNDDGSQIRRRTPVADHVDVGPRSIYVKGFPEDSTLETLTEFFEKHVAEGEKVLCIRLRRKKDKAFKSSVFVEFSTEKEAVRVSELKLKQPGDETKELLIMRKNDYIEMKKKQSDERKAAKAGADGEVEEEAAEPEEQKEFTKDLIVNFTGLGEEASRENLKEACVEAGGSVDYADFSRGQTDGYIRLQETSDKKAKALSEALMEKKVDIGGQTPTVKALEGEEEQAYWNKVWQLKKKMKNGGRKRFQGGNRNKGGRNNKRQKVES